MKLTEFRKAYEDLQRKHELPNFDDMNGVFDIGKIKRDSGNFLRDIRRMMGEKVSYYMRLMEVMINPSQAPPTFLMLLKEITKDDKKVLDSVFTAFMDIEISSYKLNVNSTDAEEVDFINKIYKIWNEKTHELIKIIDILDRNWKQVDKLPKQSRGYFS